MKRIRMIITSLACLYFYAASTQNALPAIVKKANGAYSLTVDGKPFTVLGAQLWNSSTWPTILDKTWPQIKELGCNTLEAPIYWQNIEPEQGTFNFKELDYLITGARKEGLRLILLWFGSFKNGSSQYPPEWVLTQPNKYPRVKSSGGDEMMILSTVSQENIDADKKAFAAVMKHIKEVDGTNHTVIMMQVQNEAGALGTDRDYSEAAENIFRKKVPAALTEKVNKKAGTWEEVFGPQAAETFSVWYMAKYINEVAETGKKEYNLPMYANAWPKEHGFQRPGEYPSGGPVSHMLDIWKLAAPALSVLAVDIYLGNYSTFNDLCKKYNRPDNPLFIPEMGKGTEFARNQFYALGNYNAIGVAVYGIDPFHADPNDERNKERLDDKFNYFKDNYRLLNGALDKIAELQGTGKLQAVGEDFALREQFVQAGSYDILFSYGFPGYKRTKDLTGRALIGQLGEDEFLIIGFDTKFQFKPKYGSGYSSAEIIIAEEGYYKDGKWVQTRIWNGDEIWHSTLTPEGTILKIKLRKTKKAAGAALKANFE
jgi:hypothetical protein